MYTTLRRKPRGVPINNERISKIQDTRYKVPHMRYDVLPVTIKNSSFYKQSLKRLKIDVYFMIYTCNMPLSDNFVRCSTNINCLLYCILLYFESDTVFCFFYSSLQTNLLLV